MKIIDVDNVEFQGYVEAYTPAIDSEDELEEISILDRSNRLIGFNEEEIKYIEII